jgi:uncharacterized membrane protein YphA (DoxX/SURF4 family)
MSTTDTALLLLRFGLGRMLAAHGVNKVFGPGGLDGATRWLAGLGFRPAWLLSDGISIRDLFSANGLAPLGEDDMGMGDMLYISGTLDKNAK